MIPGGGTLGANGDVPLDEDAFRGLIGYNDVVFFNRVTKMKSYIFRNFEEIYGQKVVTALSKVTKMSSKIGHTRDYGRAGLLSGQRPILSKKLKKLSPSPPPRPTLR